MTIETQICQDSYFADGTVTPRSIGFPIADPSYLVVKIDDAPQVLGSDYTITGDYANGLGQIVPITFPAGSHVLYYRETAAVQRAAIPAGQPLPSRAIEATLDRAIMLAQELRLLLDKTPVLPRLGGVNGQYAVVLPDGSWGFASGTGGDSALREDLADDAIDKGTALLLQKPVATGAIGESARDAIARILHQGQFESYSAAKAAAGNIVPLFAEPLTNSEFPGAKTRPGLITGHMVIGDTDAAKLDPDAYVGLLSHESYFGDILQEMRGISYTIEYGRDTPDEAVLGWDVIPVLGATVVSAYNGHDLLGNMKALVGELIFQKPANGQPRTIRNAYNWQATTYIEEDVTVTNWYGGVVGPPIHNGPNGGHVTNGYGLFIDNLAGGGVSFTNLAAIRLAGTGNAGRIWWTDNAYLTMDSSGKVEMSLNGFALSVTNGLVSPTAGAVSTHLNVIVNGTPFKIALLTP